MAQKDLTQLHPCFGARHNNRGRLHLPVCPVCNIECRFCDRKLNEVEQRPGVAASLLKPEEALGYVGRALELCPEITVAGIAGPGDSLADDNALETFRLVGRDFPQLIKCMSTNGLLLAERIEEVVEVGIDTLTVTVNAVAPELEAKIIRGIFYRGKRYTGAEGAAMLIERQLAGIAAATAAGIRVKVNTVLIGEINLSHIKEVAKAVAAAGASLYNIIPLIPQGEFSGLAEPACAQLDQAREAAAGYIELFRHCQRCRADAVGIPGGQDFSRQVYGGRLAARETFSHG